MIPRFKAALGFTELVAAVAARPSARARFEAAFGNTFGGAALAFPYGRSALWSFFKAVRLANAEVVLPAYTCSVVAHAIVLSGNIPRFVDLNLADYNMDLDLVAAAITPRTRAVIATHLFGYPLDLDRLANIVRNAEARHGHKIWVVQDCAHSFGAHWQGRPVTQAGDVALFGLNISKMMTAVFGGMLLTNDAELLASLRAVRESAFRRPTIVKGLHRRAYLAAAALGFSELCYSSLLWLQDHTPLLNRLTKAYHLDEKIAFPPDAFTGMTAVEAAVGLTQLRRYPAIVRTKQAHARYYDEHLPRTAGWALPPLIEGATYSHYVVRVPNRERTVAFLRRRGVELGRLIDYSVPATVPYRRYAEGQAFLNADLCSRTTINLPIYAGLSDSARARVVEGIWALVEADRAAAPSNRPVRLRPATAADVPRLAHIHHAALPDDFLPSLGLSFLERLYYPAALRSTHAVTLVAETDGPVGFVTVAHDSPAFTRDVQRGNYLTLAGYALRRALRNPLHLGQSARVFLESLHGGVEPIPSEIVFIAVDKAYRGRGVGQRLVRAAVDHLTRRGNARCRTKTLVTNTRVIALYEKLGWRVNRRFRFLGKEYVTLASASALPAAAAG